MTPDNRAINIFFADANFSNSTPVTFPSLACELFDRKIEGKTMSDLRIPSFKNQIHQSLQIWLIDHCMGRSGQKCNSTPSSIPTLLRSCKGEFFSRDFKDNSARRMDTLARDFRAWKRDKRKVTPRTKTTEIIARDTSEALPLNSRELSAPYVSINLVRKSLASPSKYSRDHLFVFPSFWKMWKWRWSQIRMTETLGRLLLFS